MLTSSSAHSDTPCGTVTARAVDARPLPLLRAVRNATAILPRAAAKKEKMMWETLREAIDEEMEADPTVLVMGARMVCTHMGQQPMLCCQPWRPPCSSGLGCRGAGRRQRAGHCQCGHASGPTQEAPFPRREAEIE